MAYLRSFMRKHVAVADITTYGSMGKPTFVYNEARPDRATFALYNNLFLVITAKCHATTFVARRDYTSNAGTATEMTDPRVELTSLTGSSIGAVTPVVTPGTTFTGGAGAKFSVQGTCTLEMNVHSYNRTT